MRSYDDGILTVYSTSNGSAAGYLPKKTLTERLKSYYGNATVGMSRYYTAMQNAKKIDDMVDIPEHHREITTDDVCLLSDDLYYRVLQVQLVTDKGEEYTRISLERIGDNYE